MKNRRLRIATWNVNEGVLGGPAGVDSYADVVPYLGEQVRALNLDVLMLQEVTFFGEGPHLAERLAGSIGFPHFVQGRLSSSHQAPQTDSGLAIVSRYPIHNTACVLLPNPGLRSTRPDGTTWISYDKGFLAGTIEWPALPFTAVSVHLVPFHSFSRDPLEPEFAGLRQTIAEALLAIANPSTILCGDFNTEHAELLLAEVISRRNLKPVLMGPTRDNGMRHDQIFIPASWKMLSSEIRPTLSDHHLCVAALSVASDGENHA